VRGADGQMTAYDETIAALRRLADRAATLENVLF
jgi:hypothetical protein